ncbi:MAG: phage tail length tape measure family protein [Sphingobium sp.]|nr:phage tail length tape measure family protein [Sphingobium sp.]
MIDEGEPGISVGFAIDFTNGFAELARMRGLIDGVTAEALKQMAQVEKASGNLLNLGNARAEITAFGNATTSAGATAAVSLKKVEKAGEGLILQLQRQSAAFGKTKEELREVAVESAALAAEQKFLPELAQRIRAEYDALIAKQNAHAAALIVQREATAQAAREHAALAAAVRNSQAAQQADAEAAERLRMSTDPLYATMKRLNAEIAESTRLYHAGVTAESEYGRQQAVLTGQLRDVERAQEAAATATGRIGGAAKLSRGDLVNLGYQVNDVIVSLASGQKPMMVFMQQGAQIGQIAAASGVGVGGMARAVAGLAAPFAPAIAAVGAAVGGFLLFERAVSQGIDTKAMVSGLGLTRAEMKRLENTSISTGDVVKATFQVMAKSLGIDLTNMSKYWGSALDWMTTTGRNVLAALYAQFVGTFRAIGAIVTGVFSGKGIGEILSDVGNAYKGAFNEANTAMTKFGQSVTKQLAANKQADLQRQAAEIRADRTPRSNARAESLAREAQATEAQIRNLYALADAYGVSGAAALIAEARVKAESEAIKKRGDIDAMVNRQIQLSIAQRVADGAKSTAGLRDQAAAQEQVNAMVAAGIIPAERAADLVRDRIADLPLLAAIEAAQQRGLTDEAKRATKALDEQRAVRERLRAATATDQFNAATQAGNGRLAELREEMRLIGATDAERVKALATIRATREAEKLNEGDRASYIAQQVQIAGLELQRQLRADAFNESLRYQADLLDAVANNVRNAANGLSDAFGRAGDALGRLASAFADHLADQRQLQTVRDQQLAIANQIEDAQLRAQRQQQINGLFAQRTLTSQIGLYGDMTSAAKGFFKQGSDGYKALETAEKAFRAVEFALSVRAIAQDAIETASSLANSGIRTAKKAVEAVVSAISSLPFPLNLAAGAATIAALASIGVGIAGAFGGGNSLPKSNDGTGSVLGDSAAKSESIKRSIDALKEVDTVMLGYSREMAASLKSIESQIGNLASLVVRAGPINASVGVTEGFNSAISKGALTAYRAAVGFALGGPIGAAIGAVATKIPIIGDIIGGITGVVRSLFGTKTKVVGSGLFGGAQSLESILSGGFDASYYSDIQKKKKFFGLTTSTKYATQYGEADSGLETQFTLILRQFNDAIAAAAGPLGVATDEVQRRLNGFVVNLGKIDLQGLTGAQIEEKLTAVFGAAADNLANTAFPGFERFQKVGEGAFETLVRVASTVEAVTASFDRLGLSAAGASIDVKVAVADQFDSVSAMTSAVQSYFETYYSKAEQTAANLAQFGKVFDSLGVAMPQSLAAFRALVEAQDLTTAAGQSTYAVLLQLAPAFADLQSSLNGAKSAADVLAERRDLERRLLELQGDTAAIRAQDLAKLDASNRALQQQIYAIEDARAAAQAADELRKAWASVGDSIMDEVKRIRGLTGGNSDGNFAVLMGQFNAATAAARAGDQDAAKTLPGLSQSLLRAAELVATSRQELDRVQGQTAASLEQTYAAIQALAGSASTSTASTLTTAATAAQAASPTASAANDDLASEVRALREEVERLRAENNAGHAATAGNTGAIKRTMENVTQASGGEAISVTGAAA